MKIFEYIKDRLSKFGKDTQKIGLAQFKTSTDKKVELTPSLKNKDIKLSDLMRRIN